MSEIARRPNLPYLSYVFEHLVPRVPVLVPGACSAMGAVHEWTPAYLRQQYGDRLVRLDRGGRFESAQLQDFIREIEAEESRPDDERAYLRNVFLSEVFPELLSDVALPVYCSPNWLSAKALQGFVPPVWSNWIELFVSGSGTRFPRVHVDSSMTHAWVIGVYGQKQFWAWPPREGQPSFSIHSEEHQRQRGLDCRGKDLERFFEHAQPVKCLIEPGDFLFLPTGWWHTAESTTTAISLSGNFVNETNWDDFTDCWFRGLKHRPGLQSLGELLSQRPRQ